MFVFLSKLLPLLIYPVGMVCLLLIFILFTKNEKIRKFSTLIAIFVLFTSGNKWFSMTITKSLEWQYLPMKEYPETEAIVVLGGGTGSKDYPRPMVDINAAGDRVLYAGSLFKQGKAPIILLSGGTISWMESENNSPADQMKEILILMDIPEDVLILQKESQNTYEDALYSTQLLNEKGIKKIILVTSALHMPRSVMLFKKQGLKVIPAPTDYRVTKTSLEQLKNPNLESFLINLLPNVSNISGLTNAMKEYFGILVYRWRGWL